MMRSFAYLLLTAYLGTLVGVKYPRYSYTWVRIWLCIGIAVAVSIVAMFI